MEEKIPWLQCRTGRKCCLLARDEKAFYLIEVGRRLDADTEYWLIHHGISEQVLQQRQLAYEYIPRNVLRGVALEGNQAGERIFLYPKSGKRKLMLDRDYENADMEKFFEGIAEFAPPKSREPGLRGWRKERQNRELFHKLRYVSPGLFMVSCGVNLCYVVSGNWILFTLSLMCLAAQLGLAVAMPVYFTIHLPKGAKKQNVYNLELPLTVSVMILFFRFRLNWMSYDALWYIIPVGAVLGALVYWRVVDLHQEDGGLLASVMLGIFLTLILATQINEVYDFTPPRSYCLEVEDLRYSSGKNSSYYCTVTLPDGAEEELRVSAELYRQLEEGDLVRVEVDTGVLGIDYGKVTGKEK